MSKRVILVEDNPSDVRLVSEALSRIGFSVKLEVFRDGFSALEFFTHRSLNGLDKIALVLIDIGMPRLNGIELLHEIKGNPATKNIPVVIFSGSAGPGQMEQGYGFGANGFVPKPDKIPEQITCIEKLLDYWLNLNQIPDGHFTTEAAS